MRSKHQDIKDVIWLELKHGDDLLKTISNFCLKHNINAGLVMVIGALQEARFSYYDQKEKKYRENSTNEPVEIVSCVGNISMKNGQPFVHAHIVFANSRGNVSGGHLTEGCVVFAGECAILKSEGELLERKPDQLTGLSLWDFS